MFAHTNSSSWYNKPTNFTWCREDYGDVVVFTDTSLNMVDGITRTKKYAWLIESPLYTKLNYDFIRTNFNKFDSVFTFDKELLNLSPKFHFLPIGGCWISEGDRVIHDKNKLLSIIASRKQELPGHILRHEIIKKFNNIDVFGNGYNPIDNKILALGDYKFSIVVENCKKDYYFTEKLIDCFITGTIPIYWGCPSINDFFDSDGIISFDTLEDLKLILNNLNDDLYLNKINSVRKNFELSKKFLIADDIIYEKIKNG